jgi:hypothetical protein
MNSPTRLVKRCASLTNETVVGRPDPAVGKGNGGFADWVIITILWLKDREEETYRSVIEWLGVADAVRRPLDTSPITASGSYHGSEGDGCPDDGTLPPVAPTDDRIRDSRSLRSLTVRRAHRSRIRDPHFLRLALSLRTAHRSSSLSGSRLGHSANVPSGLVSARQRGLILPWERIVQVASVC